MNPISGLNQLTALPAPAAPSAPPAQSEAPKDEVEIGGKRSFGHSLARGVFGAAGGIGGAVTGFAGGAIRHAGDRSVQVPGKLTGAARLVGAGLGLLRGVVVGLGQGPVGLALGVVVGPVLGAMAGGGVVGAAEAGVDALKGGFKGGFSGARKGIDGGQALADRWFGPKDPGQPPQTPPSGT
jgi:hypothetical protein